MKRKPSRWSGPSMRATATSGPVRFGPSADLAPTSAVLMLMDAVLGPADLVDFLHPGVRLLERGLGAEPCRHHAPRHVGEDVLRADLDRRRRDRARVALGHAAEDVLEDALEVGIRLPVRILGALLVDRTGLADRDLEVLGEALLVLHVADQVLAEIGVLALLEDAPVVAGGAHEAARRAARREDELGL